MDYFLVHYFEQCKILFAPLGFWRRSNSFFRVANDVVQRFDLKRWGNGHVCTVEFAVIPLCAGVSYLKTGGYSVEQFDVSGFGTFLYDKQSKESVEKCIQKLLQAVQTYVLPFFAEANSCAAAFPRLIALEELFRNNWIERCRCQHIVPQQDGPAVDFLDTAKYYMALKTENYAFALQCKRAVLQQNLNAYQSISQTIPDFPAEKLAQRRKEIERHQVDIQHLEASDTAYFQTILKDNEARARESLGLLNTLKPDFIATN